MLSDYNEICSFKTDIKQWNDNVTPYLHYAHSWSNIDKKVGENIWLRVDKSVFWVFVSAIRELLIRDITQQEVTALDEATNLVLLFYPELGSLWIVRIFYVENNRIITPNVKGLWLRYLLVPLTILWLLSILGFRWQVAKVWCGSITQALFIFLFSESYGFSPGFSLILYGGERFSRLRGEECWEKLLSCTGLLMKMRMFNWPWVH